MVSTSDSLNILKDDIDIVPCVESNKPLITNSTFDLLDPHTGKLLYKVSSAKPADAVKVVDTAAAAFPAWKNTSVVERRAIFLRAADILRQNVERFTNIEISETTSGTGHSSFEIGLGIAALEELAATATSALKGEVAAHSPMAQQFLLREPWGVVFAIAPWNAPTILGTRAIATPIMAGNTVVLKSSEFSPRMHSLLAHVFIEAGLPPGVLNIIHVAAKDAPEVTEAVIAHPAVRKVNFTGSTRIGKIVGELCGRHIKPVVLELGGTGSLIVLEDANIEFAANAAVFGGFNHQGQICMHTNQTLVHESIATKFTALLEQKLAHKKADSSNTSQMRGLYTEFSAERIQALVDDAVQKGAKVGAGTTLKREGNLLQPVIVEGVTTDMLIYSEEIFGPAMSIMTFKTDEEAIKLANGSGYGLACSIYSTDTARAYKVAQNVEAGLVHINHPTIRDDQQVPHGGWKKSGFGRFNGFEGLREFTQTKTLTIAQYMNFPE